MHPTSHPVSIQEDDIHPVAFTEFPQVFEKLILVADIQPELVDYTCTGFHANLSEFAG